MIGSSIAVLATLAVLLRSISTEPATPATSERVHDRLQPSPGAPTASSPSTGGGPLPQIERPPPRDPDVPSRAPTSSDSPPTLAGADDAPPGSPANTKNLQFGMPQLREKIATNTPQLAACISTAGSRPSGNATVTFIVAQRGSKYIVEQTDIDPEATSLADAPLLDCFAKATSAMVFDGLPREAPAILVTRTIALENGAITEDKPLRFSYLR